MNIITIDIDDIAQRLECIEGNTDREYNIKSGEQIAVVQLHESIVDISN